MRLTNDMRDAMLRRAMQDVPNVDYLAQMTPVVQNVLYSHMPASAQMLYDNPATRAYLQTNRVEVLDGNKRFFVGRFCGVPGRNDLTARVDDAGFMAMKKGTKGRAVAVAVRRSGLLQKHIEQRDLLDSVRRRLQSTLRYVSTVKRLRDVLEPELHYIIPEETDLTANLPASAAPVADDLRRLGARFSKEKESAE